MLLGCGTVRQWFTVNQAPDKNAQLTPRHSLMPCSDAGAGAADRAWRYHEGTSSHSASQICVMNADEVKAELERILAFDQVVVAIVAVGCGIAQRIALSQKVAVGIIAEGTGVT